MNEVEKMYENAGVKYYKEICAIKNVIDKVGDQECYFEVSCTSCPLNKTSFTAEKQLELIKWLGELDMLEIMRTTREDKAWIINSEYGMSGNVYKHTSRMKSFEEALASLINSLWQDLTEEDKAQIKNILESEVRE